MQQDPSFFLATDGHSSESKNVCVWDSLQPHGKALVVAWTCHEQSASSLLYLPQHQLLISAGKRGDVSQFEMRTRTVRHRFQAHESPINPHEEYFGTGSADGDIKIWDVAGT
ncbi:Rabconnectin-3A [Carabus blaptoides fortunei]